MTTDRDSAIAERAYQIWESEGRPDGKALDHWLQAEAAISAGGATAQAPPAAKPAAKPAARQKRPAKRK